LSSEIGVIFLRPDIEPEVRFCRGCSSPQRSEYWSHYLERCMTTRGMHAHIDPKGDYDFLRNLHGESFETKSLYEVMSRAELVIFLVFDEAGVCLSMKGHPVDDVCHLWYRSARQPTEPRQP